MLLFSRNLFRLFSALQCAHDGEVHWRPLQKSTPQIREDHTFDTDPRLSSTTMKNTQPKRCIMEHVGHVAAATRRTPCTMATAMFTRTAHREKTRASVAVTASERWVRLATSRPIWSVQSATVAKVCDSSTRDRLSTSYEYTEVVHVRRWLQINGRRLARCRKEPTDPVVRHSQNKTKHTSAFPARFSLHGEAAQHVGQRITGVYPDSASSCLPSPAIRRACPRPVFSGMQGATAASPCFLQAARAALHRDKGPASAVWKAWR